MKPTTPTTRSRQRLPLALVAALLLAPALALRAGETRTERFERAFELGGIDQVRVQNVNGAVHIGTWDRDYVRVTATKKARGSEAEGALRETEIRIGKSGRTLNVETVLPKKKAFGFLFLERSRNVEVAYELLLPGKTAVEVETVNGRISAEKRAGAIELNTVNGSVRVDAHDAPLHINTVNGSVEAIFVGEVKETSLETVNGSVTVVCGKDSSFRYDLQTVNGRIESQFAEVRVERSWGPKEARGEINGGRNRLAVETVNGEVRLLARSEIAVKPAN